MGITIENSWKNTGGLWQDPDLAGVKSSLLRYRPRPIQPQECLSPLVLTLRGPRRSGKTVSLKLLVAELIEEKGMNPKDITWTSLETLRTLKQMEEHLLEVFSKYKPKILFIDEVTSVTGWQQVIKKYRDNGLFSQMCIVLTGSSAHDLKAGAERMAGRRGGFELYDRVLLPMSYKDFHEQTEGAVEDYLSVGGFPFRVNQFKKTKVQNLTWDDSFGMSVFDEVFFYEITRRKLSRSIGLEVLSRISQIKTTSISYESFAKSISITKDTARKYLDVLGESFLLSTISHYDTSKGRVAPKKEKKLTWVDPALGSFASWTKQGESLDSPARAELVVGIELIKRHEMRLWEGLSAPRNVFTWKSKSGSEIDFLVVDRSKKLTYPIEVKFQNEISNSDFIVMEKAFGKGLLVTKNDTRKREKSSSVKLSEFLLSDDLF